MAESGLSWGVWGFISGPRKLVPGKAWRPPGAHGSFCAHRATLLRLALKASRWHGGQRRPLGFRGLQTSFHWLPPTRPPSIYIRQLPRAFGRPPPRARRRLLNSSKTRSSLKHSTWAYALRKGLWASNHRNAWHQTRKSTWSAILACRRLAHPATVRGLWVRGLLDAC